MEIRQIPDYPNYGVTRDGRVWSYKTNKFLSPYKKEWGYQVGLSFEGHCFYKLVHRIVFQAFHGFEPERVRHKDGNLYNNSIDNLIEVTASDITKTAQKTRKSRYKKIIYQIDTQTGVKTVFEKKDKNMDYSGISHVLEKNPQAITCKGYMYFYEGKKNKLINDIKGRIRSNELTLLYTDPYSPFRKVVQNHIERYEKYLEILEGVEDYA